MTSPINEAILRLSKRAEKNDRGKLAATFVDVGPLFAMLSNRDDQILYGRRGTGKTHAFQYLDEMKRSDGHISIYIDLRNIGSSAGMYSDSRYPITQRATRLLLDAFETIHESLHMYFITSEEFDFSKIAPLLDDLASSITEVQVVGNIEQERAATVSDSKSLTQAIDVNIETDSLGVVIKDNSEKSKKIRLNTGLRKQGLLSREFSLVLSVKFLVKYLN